jgi:hypothetical protein
MHLRFRLEQYPQLGSCLSQPFFLVLQVLHTCLAFFLLGEAIANLSRHVHVNLVPEAAVVNDGRQYATCGYMVAIRDIARATVGRHCVAYG